ncbi:MAG TPA: V-type ATP synthase subunit E family protein [Thermoplasmata archaeon]|nr:V-type ATP synthase subunit E family protein [Thermoplasmata archaeon]
MSLETLVEEIRRQGEADLAALTSGRDAEVAKIAADRDRQIEEARTEISHATEVEIAHERAQRVAAAKLQARKLLYEAREQRLEGALDETRTLLQEYTRSAQYPAVLRRMMAAAAESLGKQLRISGRSEDASLLAKVAGKGFDPTPQPILGGLIAETPDGERRLNLSFDELLRLREDRVRELLA